VIEVTSEIKFDTGMIEKGQWTKQQKETIKQIITEIESVLKKRFPYVADNMRLNYHLPEEGIGIKFIAEYSVKENIDFGGLDCRHHMDLFREEPEASENLLKAMINNHVVFVYEQVIMRALGEHLSNLVAQTKKFGIKDNGQWFKNRKTIIASASIPEGFVLMHPNTMKDIKKMEGE
jgi:hypothetical protein